MGGVTDCAGPCAYQTLPARPKEIRTQGNVTPGTLLQHELGRRSNLAFNAEHPPHPLRPNEKSVQLTAPSRGISSRQPKENHVLDQLLCNAPSPCSIRPRRPCRRSRSCQFRYLLQLETAWRSRARFFKNKRGSGPSLSTCALHVGPAPPTQINQLPRSGSPL